MVEGRLMLFVRRISCLVKLVEGRLERVMKLAKK